MVMRMPDELVARARLVADGGAWTPPQPRAAATVVLLRDGGAGLEVLLMRRPSTMAFAPGMHVFPGGRVDPVDDARPKVHGFLPGPPWAPDPATASALVVAAIRETFEEAGVLIALDRSGRTPTPDGTWAQDRERSETPGGFAAVLARRRLHLVADLLHPVAHWVTPEVENRRFDTRFFLAALPVGQDVTAHASETASAVWLTPDEALAGAANDQLPMLPPTVAVLADLAGRRHVGDALEAARGRTVAPVMPHARLEGDRLDWVLVHAYDGHVIGPSSEPAGSEERGER